MDRKKILKKYPELQSVFSKLDNLEKNSGYPPGHFYSSIFDVDELKKREQQIWKGAGQKTVASVDLNEKEQVELVRELVKFYPEMPFGKPGLNLRYNFENNFYSYTDAIILYSMMRNYQPKRIIEVGSGYSSAVMLDTKEHFQMDTELVFIEPYPDRLNSLLRNADSNHCRVIVDSVQNVSPQLFAGLRKGDILFIDSSHVVKTGSDLHYLIFDILPLLNSGVIIHFHDVFYPFEYPKKWIFEGRNWNEDYFIRAFLMYNKEFKIIFFAHYLHVHHPDVFKEMPLCYKNYGGNIWLEKV